MKHPTKVIASSLRALTVLILCSSILLPMYMVLINSFKSKRDSNQMGLNLPVEWLWENYQHVIEKGKLISSFLNSCLYAFSSAAVVVLLASLATYVLARRYDKLAKRLYFFLIVGLFLPVNHVVLIKIMSIIGLYGSRMGVILYYLASNMSFSVFVCYGYFSNLPRELDEAALIDGASPFRTFTSVIFPLLKPISVTIFILTFMGIWSDFMTPLYLINLTALWPMNLAIYNFFGRYDAYWNYIFADIVLTVLPVMVLYLFCQKQIIGGLTTGAVKG